MKIRTSAEVPPLVTGSVPGRPGQLLRFVAAATLLVLAGFALVWVAGCGGSRSRGDGGISGSPADGAVTTVYHATTTAASMGSDVARYQGGEAAPSETIISQASVAGKAGGLGALTGPEHKVVSNASLQIEVETGKFQAVFEQVRLLADKYGGYIISADSSASGKERMMRSGVIALRVPSQSLNGVLADAVALGKVTAQQVQSQDVTEEYVDLKARLKNAEAQEEALLSLMRQATTVEDTLRVRDVLSSVQGEIEQIKGRLNYLDEHSSYATLTVSLYETGMVVATTGGWGFIEALREAARALVGTVNELIVFLGGALPVLVLLALIAWVVYVVVRATMRRRQQRRAEWAATHPAPPVTAAPLGAPTSPAADAGPAPSGAEQGTHGSPRM